MSGFSRAFWLWLPVLIYKAVSAFFRTIWKFNLWTLQTICGVPLYYCKPQYRIPGIFFGTLGMVSVFSFIVFLLSINSDAAQSVSRQAVPLNEILMTCGIGLGLLFLCRILIRRGSI